MGEEEERNKTDHQRQEAAVPARFGTVGPGHHRLQSAAAAVDLGECRRHQLICRGALAAAVICMVRRRHSIWGVLQAERLGGGREERRRCCERGTGRVRTSSGGDTRRLEKEKLTLWVQIRWANWR